MGIMLYGFYRDRDHFDANDDDFSEIVTLNNTTIGSRIFYRVSERSKLTADFFNMKEKRRGGNKFESVPHEADIAEYLKHNLTTGAFTYEQFFREYDLLTIYVSGQKINRDAYYGAEQALDGYGNTKDFSYTVGTQYNIKFENSNLTIGVENNGAYLKDKKLGYPDIDNAIVDNDGNLHVPHIDNTIVANQTANTFGVFAQYEIEWNKFKFSAGTRFDSYNVKNKELADADNSGNILIPRVSIKYDMKEYLQARLSYSQGYRIPQIFDEDLHIEVSGARKVIHKNDPDLKREKSHSFTASLDFNKQIGKAYIGFLLEAFYTKLNDPFLIEYSEPDENKTVTYLRSNADEGAKVKGINIELNVVPTDWLSLTSGFTIQNSKYTKVHAFNEKDFFRAPNHYGYLTANYQPLKNGYLSLIGNYTGKMLIPYFGPETPNPKDGKLRKSSNFFDLGAKFGYTIKLNNTPLELFAGMKNIFNSYQSDFDKGVERDPGYIYGPLNPRTVYFGFKVGNFFNKRKAFSNIDN